MRYPAIQKMMIQGQFRIAQKHLDKVLKTKPDDPDAKHLSNICKQMLELIESAECTNLCNNISIAEYCNVHYRRFMKKSCSFIVTLLDKLPEKYQKKFKKETFFQLELRFTRPDDAQKDWMWEMLFWDNRRRKYLYSILGCLLVCGICLMIGLSVSNSAKTSSAITETKISYIFDKANQGDPKSQYQLGVRYYQGIGVKKDVEQSYYWLTLAAKSGDKEAAALLERMVFEIETQRTLMTEPEDKNLSNKLNMK